MRRSRPARSTTTLSPGKGKVSGHWASIAYFKKACSSRWQQERQQWGVRWSEVKSHGTQPDRAAKRLVTAMPRGQNPCPGISGRPAGRSGRQVGADLAHQLACHAVQLADRQGAFGCVLCCPGAGCWAGWMLAGRLCVLIEKLPHGFCPEFSRACRATLCRCTARSWPPPFTSSTPEGGRQACVCHRALGGQPLCKQAAALQ